MRNLLRVLADHPFASLISFVASIIAICTFFSGIESIPALLARLSIQSFDPPNYSITNSDSSLQPLLEKTVWFTIVFSEDLSLKINFELGEVATGDTPVDLEISNCYAYIWESGIHCDMLGASLRYAGSLDLDEITDRIGFDIGRLINEGLEERKSYVLYAEALHPVKFQVSRLQIVYDAKNPVTAVLELHYIYQTNDRQDFQGP
jgi:hypothetical protein